MYLPTFQYLKDAACCFANKKTNVPVHSDAPYGGA